MLCLLQQLVLVLEFDWLSKDFSVSCIRLCMCRLSLDSLCIISGDFSVIISADNASRQQHITIFISKSLIDSLKKKTFIQEPNTEPILPIRRIRMLHRAPELPGGPLALKDVLILVLFLILASGSENMNDRLF